MRVHVWAGLKPEPEPESLSLSMIQEPEPGARVGTWVHARACRAAVCVDYMAI